MTLPSSAVITVVDDLNQELILESPARRIISLSPHLTENLYTVGAGEQLIAASRFSDYPEQAKSLRQVGDAQALNVEYIVSLQPDLILAWVDGGNSASILQLQELGIPIYWSKPIKLEGIAQELQRLAILTGRTADGQRAASEFNRELESLRRYSQRTPVTVFYQVWNPPLQTLNKNTLINDLINLCGGQNIFADVGATVATIDIEHILKLDPSVILGSHIPGQKSKWADHWQQWPGLSAVKKGHIYSVDANLIARHTVRALSGAQQLCGYVERARGV